MYKAVISAFGVMVLLLGFHTTVFAQQDSVGCNKAVIVYLDVSGSMSEERNDAVSIKTGKRISLMQAMGEMFEELFSKGTGMVGPDDYFQLKGFYSNVAPLVADRACFKDIQQSVLKKAAALQHKGPGFENLHKFIGPLGYKTSFASVLKDMDETSRRLLSPGSSYRKIVYVLLTDGLDDSGNAETLRQAFEDNSLSRSDSAQRSKTKILMFGLPNNNSPKENEIKVQQGFENYLDASVYPCGIELDTNGIIKTVREQTVPAIEVLQIGSPEPTSNSEEIHIPIKFINDSCDDLLLKTFSWSITSSGGPSPLQLRDIEVPKQDFMLNARSSTGSIKEYILKLRSTLPAGEVEISVQPETLGGGFGQAKRVIKEVHPYILLRNTNVYFSKERDRVIVKTMLVNKFDKDLQLGSLHVNLSRIYPARAEKQVILKNHVIPCSDQQVVLSPSSTDEMYRRFAFGIDLPEVLPGEYVIDVYAHEKQYGGEGNLAEVHSIISPSAHIENITTVETLSEDISEIQLTLGNRCNQPVVVDAVRIMETSNNLPQNSLNGWDWEELDTKVVPLSTPVTLPAGEHTQASFSLNKKHLTAGADSRLFLQAVNLREGSESPAVAYSIPLAESSPLLGFLFVIAALALGVISYRSIKRN